MSAKSLLESGPRVINIGLATFGAALHDLGVEAVNVQWSPPAGGDPALHELLVRAETLHGPRIEEANRQALERMAEGEPVLVDVMPAGEAIEGLDEFVVLHAGPPITWERMCGPMRGAVAGAAVLEGWAGSLDEAHAMAAAGEFELRPNHHHHAVGPMTGITTRGMPVLIVENRRFGNRACCTLNEGLGKVMRFGGNDEAVLQRLRWLATVVGPALAAALRSGDGIALKGLVARGLAMGDEMHQRNVACSSLLLRELAPALARSVEDPTTLGSILEFVAGNDQFFLNVAMAMGKALMDPVRGIEHSSVVTAMSRNGTDFGIRVSATGDAWFTAPVQMPRGLYFPGFGEADANPDMGDSTIVETIGLGGFAMAAAPAVAGFVGAGAASDAAVYTRAMYEITVGRNAQWPIPALDFAGVPSGIDIRRVVEAGVTPTINTGIAHREAGIGQVGAGVVEAPLACFEQALRAFGERLKGV